MAKATKYRPINKAQITDADVEEARLKAIKLCDTAYAPHDVKQPDGSVLQLCLHARCIRASEMIADARRRGDMEAVARLEKGYATLRTMYQSAADAAEEAAADWAAKALVVGKIVAPDAVYPPACTCPICAVQAREQAYRQAVMAAREEVYRLLAPGASRPPLLALLERAREDVGARDRLWNHLVRIGSAFTNVESACAALDRKVNYRDLL